MKPGDMEIIIFMSLYASVLVGGLTFCFIWFIINQDPIIKFRKNYKAKKNLINGENK